MPDDDGERGMQICTEEGYVKITVGGQDILLAPKVARLIAKILAEAADEVEG